MIGFVRDVLLLLAAVMMVMVGLLGLAHCADQSAKWSDTPAVVVSTGEAAAAEAAAKTPSATASFRKTLSAAAEKAYRDKQITRWDLARIRLAITLRPRAIDEAQACVTDEACAAGVMPLAAAGDTAFDWGKLLEFIRQLLPEILAIIKLFSV
jgi:hypothetical protein